MRAFLVIAAALAISACEASKSSNPLSPSVAGPLQGVNISAPAVVTPASGTKVAVDQQPLTLTVQNATTNGPRPLSYVFEIATDSNFNTITFSRPGVTPGDGKTSLQLPDPLATGHTYFWRAHAQDGANTGGYSPTSMFSIFTPVVINAPVPVSPALNSVVDSVRPTLVVTNAVRTGPAGTISYAFEVADNDAFANKIAWTVSEAS